jgi:DNA mismatch endonuclease, patch repair protein
MRAVKDRDTTPELIVRRLAHAMGYRFRLHRTDLPGKPDLVFPRLRKVLFVHGCFWHGHPCARGARVPVHNRRYWIAKIARNKERDRKARAALKALGWKSLALWECELKDPVKASKIVKRFLGA